MTLTPAYGRDYNSRAAILLDLAKGLDFQVADVFGGNAGRYANYSDLADNKVREVTVRYGKLRKVTVIKLSEVTKARAGLKSDQIKQPAAVGLPDRDSEQA